jgi:high-affinity iron transporter
VLRRLLAALLLALALTGAAAGTAAAVATQETWNHVVDDMEAILDGAYDMYVGGDAEGAKDEVDEAYFGYYEKLGFEKTVMAYISGSRASAVEYQFALTRRRCSQGTRRPRSARTSTRSSRCSAKTLRSSTGRMPARSARSPSRC